MINKISRNKARLARHARIRQKISGDAKTPRLCVFKSNKHFEAQIIDDTKGATLVSTSTLRLKIKESGNIEAAIKVGTEIAKLAKEKKITTVVFDRGGNVYHGRVKAFAEAAREGGLKF